MTMAESTTRERPQNKQLPTKSLLQSHKLQEQAKWDDQFTCLFSYLISYYRSNKISREISKLETCIVLIHHAIRPCKRFRTGLANCILVFLPSIILVFLNSNCIKYSIQNFIYSHKPRNSLQKASNFHRTSYNQLTRDELGKKKHP